jgi:hypothetical protein
MTRYAVVNNANIVTRVTFWDEISPWTPEDYQEYDADGNPIGDPTPQIAVPDTDPPTAQIGYSYNPGDGTFTLIPEIPPSSPNFISKVMSVLNRFSAAK